MQKKLNISLLNLRTEELGLNLTDISKELGVSREAVSQWFKNQSFPRPRKLLNLSRILNLKHGEVVVKESIDAPIVAFRKVKNAKTSETHLKRAKEIGYSLKRLVKYLPFETVTKPPELISPKIEYEYIQNAVRAIKEKLEINKIGIGIEEIIKCFNKYKTILIPVLLGSRKNHENALHIHLPESATNWVYINLDTKVFDFKFWLVHELGHIFTPNLTGEVAEDFADNFAGAFLFPEEISKNTYEQLIKNEDEDKKISVIIHLAKRYFISPYTVYYEVNKYAEHYDKPKVILDSKFHKNINKFVNSYPLISEDLFGKDKPDASEYIKLVESEFETLFFKALKGIMKNEEISASYIRNVLNISNIDAKEIYSNLLDGLHKNPT